VSVLRCVLLLPVRAGILVLTDGLSQLPFWALVSFGAYLLFKLGWGVFSFNDVPEAYSELMKEIQIARADLRSKGVDVD